VSELKITLRRSLIGCTQEQRRTARSLGLRKIRQSVRRPDNDSVRGMVRALAHLVDVEQETP
jgi:large subunit ribosomal protein L30